MGINLPEEFYQAEERCGYLVSEKMKKIWAVELDMIQKFVEVCEKHNLRYFMDGGTLLGAVRHKGFIPWDDDADIIMPREDYNKLFEVAQDEFKHPYFFQSTMSEDGFFRTHAQIRNSETTGFIKIDGEKEQVNKGIFIDIFVLDGIADNRILRFFQRKEIAFKKKILAYEYDRHYEVLSFGKRIFYKMVHAFFKVYPFKKFFNHFNRRVLARYSKKDTEMVGNITLKWKTRSQWPRIWYDGYINLPFENLTLRAPLFYKDVLIKLYGDYMRIPKNVLAANGKLHGSVVFDPDTPYKEYFEKMKMMQAENGETEELE